MLVETCFGGIYPTPEPDSSLDFQTNDGMGQVLPVRKTGGLDESGKQLQIILRDKYSNTKNKPENLSV